MNTTDEAGIKSARIMWDADGQPRSVLYGDIYFSRDNGLAESRAVFLHHNHLPGAWYQHQRESFTIIELGFGTGLNFLATWQLFRRQTAFPYLRRLHFISLEKYPLDKTDLSRALNLWPELENYAVALLEEYPAVFHARHRFAWGNISLELRFGEALDSLYDLERESYSADAWYLDGFSPRTNPAMWQEKLFIQIAKLSQTGATLATFSAAGSVRRGLCKAGFEVKKTPGFGRKREMLQGMLKSKPEWVR